jgi:periplasmic divalent cation tolerance protein
MGDPNADDVVLGITTFAANAEAVAFVRALVDRRVIACGTLLPGGRSVYRWEGRVNEDAETVVLLKTTRARVPELKHAFGELHPYATPELLVFAAGDGLPAYLAWVASEVRSDDSGGRVKSGLQAQVDARRALPCGQSHRDH